MNDLIPRKTTLKNLKISGYNIYSLCNGELFNIVHHSDDICDILRYTKHLKSKYYDDFVIEILFE